MENVRRLKQLLKSREFKIEIGLLHMKEIRIVHEDLHNPLSLFLDNVRYIQALKSSIISSNEILNLRGIVIRTV